MTDLRQAAQAALAELDDWAETFDDDKAYEIADALRAALAQPEPQHYPLPDELYAESKDWRTANYAGRVEWLRTMYESKKREADSAFAMLAAQTPKAEPVLYWHKPKTDDQKFIEPEAVNGHCPDCVPLYLHPPAALAEPGPKPKLFTLSDRLRPGVECAAWVIDDVRRLESAHAHQYSMAGQMLREAERAGRERDEAVAALRSIVETISLGLQLVYETMGGAND